MHNLNIKKLLCRDYNKKNITFKNILPSFFNSCRRIWRISSDRKCLFLSQTNSGMDMDSVNNKVANNLLRHFPEPQLLASVIASIYSLSSCNNPLA